MRVFRVKPDFENERLRYRFDAEHPFSLPGFRCSCTDGWATVGASFPAFDMSGYPWSDRLEADLVDFSDFQELKALVKSVLPKHLDPQPGWEFGPLTGKLSGNVGDFAWDRWYLLVRQERVGTFRRRGLRLPKTVAARLTQKGGPVPLQELHMEPLVELTAASFKNPSELPCPVCGRDRRTLEEPVLCASTMPDDVDLFRLKLFPAKIYVTERFRDVIGENELSDMLFEEAQVDAGSPTSPA